MVHSYRLLSHHDVHSWFYSAEVISEAKRCLLSELQPKPIVERRNSTSEAEGEDIVGIFDAADMQPTLGSCHFVASRLVMLPNYGPEELNLAAVLRLRNDLYCVEWGVKLYSLTLAAVFDKHVKMECTIDTVSAFAISWQQRHSVCMVTGSKCAPTLTLAVFGVKEDRDSTVWREQVLDERSWAHCWHWWRSAWFVLLQVKRDLSVCVYSTGWNFRN